MKPARAQFPRLALLALFALALALTGFAHRMPSAGSASLAAAFAQFPGAQICAGVPEAPAPDTHMPYCPFCEIAGAAQLPCPPAQQPLRSARARRNRPPLQKAPWLRARRKLRPAPRAPPAPRNLA